MIYWIAISAVLLFGYAVLMLFYFVGWKRTRKYSVDASLPLATKVSIIIAARNEEFNIGDCIRSIFKQDYPKELFEIIIVNDHSEDKTLEVASSFNPSRVRVFNLARYLSGDTQPVSFKKKGIELGIRHSTGDLIITTDADCTHEPKWLSTIVTYYEKFHPKVIAAPVAFTGERSFLEKWQSLDLCGMMAITGGAITNGFPNMCNGANLTYEKKAFEEVNGFAGVDNQSSGDDVMLMMKVDKEYPGSVHFLKSRDAVVFTKAVETLPELFQQRVRWLSKGTAFPDWRVSVTLVCAWLFNLSIIINLIGGFFFKELWVIAGISFLVKTFFELPLLWSGCAFFKKEKLLFLILPAQVMHILYVIIAGGASRFYKYEWKGRR